MTRFMYCRTCKICTNHKFISGSWLCWCKRIQPIKLEGSDTSMQTQLQDAGYDTGGVF